MSPLKTAKTQRQAEDPPCSATGGSASSQAMDLDERSWRPRPLLGGSVRVLAAVGPFVVTYLIIRLAIRVVPRPVDNLGLLLVWFVSLGVFATAVLRVAGLGFRRIVPVSMLMRASLLFPDKAPSRFGLALRAATGRQLAAAVESGTSADRFRAPQEAAEELLVQLAALSRHDRMTRGHSERVRAYTDLIAEEMDLGAEDAAKLRWAALLHDIGKLEVPEAILNKDGRPTDDEWEIIRRHPAAASRRLEALTPWLGEWAMAATDHHERYDGKGYPRGLAGEQISRAGRIVAVADAYDVMTAPRSYKPSLPAEQARVELAANSGTQFDPDVLRAFLAVSLGRRRLLAGPLAWFAQLPTIISGPVASMGTAGVGIVPTVAVGTTLALAGAANIGGVLDDMSNLVPGPFGPDAPTEVAAGDEFGGPLYEASEQVQATAAHSDAAPEEFGTRRGGDDRSGSSGDRHDGDASGLTPPDELAAAAVGPEETPEGSDDASSTLDPTTEEASGPDADAGPTSASDGEDDPVVPSVGESQPPDQGEGEAQARSSGSASAAEPPPAPAEAGEEAFDGPSSPPTTAAPPPTTAPPPPPPLPTTLPGPDWAAQWDVMIEGWDGWGSFDDAVAWWTWPGWSEWDGWRDWSGWDELTGGSDGWFSSGGQSGGGGGKGGGGKVGGGR
jgi:hypothetical protein